MAIERETIIERDRETVVDGGSPFGGIIGVISAIVVVLLAIWLFAGLFNGGGADAVSVDLPTVSVEAD